MSLFRLLGVGSQVTTESKQQANKLASISGADCKQFGLENFGNTCYINAVFQALYFCPPFRDLVIATPDSSNPAPAPLQSLASPPPPAAAPLSSKNPWSPRTVYKRKDSSAADHLDSSNGAAATLVPLAPPISANPPSLFSALRSLFIHIAQNPLDNGKVPPTAFVKKVKDENEAFRNNNHQDAHELLNFVLNQVVEDLEAAAHKTRKSEANSPPASSSIGKECSSSSNRTLVHALFEGVLTSETRCLTCETVSSRDESFLDLSIDIEPNSSVTSCLRQFSASEMLCQRNKFSCDSCSGLQEAERRMKVKRLPNILALHLKRFKYQEDVQKFIKLSYRVAFPFELRLFNTVDDAENADRLYELFAIVVHIGGGPHHGHYTSIIKSKQTWFLFDDDNVEPIKESDIPKYFGESNVGAGYVLFYQAADLDYSSVGLAIPLPNTSGQSKGFIEGQAIIEESERNTSTSLAESRNDAQGPVHPLAEQTAVGTTQLPDLGKSSMLHASQQDGYGTPTVPTVPPTNDVQDATAIMPSRSGSKRLSQARASPVVEVADLTDVVLSTIPNGAMVAEEYKDAESSDNRRSWFTRNKTLKKKSKELATPRGPSSNETKSEHYSSSHLRRTTAHNGPQEGPSEHEATVDVPFPSVPTQEKLAVMPSSVRLPSGHEIKQSSTEPSSTSSSRPSTGISGPPRLTQVKVTTPGNQVGDIQRASLQPTPSLVSPSSMLQSDLTHLHKKAARKVSLSSIPFRFTGLVNKGGREKDP